MAKQHLYFIWMSQIQNHLKQSRGWCHTIISANVGNMKSWLVPTFQTTTNADSQFFILRVSASTF